MAFTTTRPNPAIVTATDAGVALDQYLDGDMAQCYVNFSSLQAGSVQSFKGSYASVGARFSAVEAAMTSPAGIVKTGTFTEMAAYASPLDGMRWHINAGSSVNQDYIYDIASTSFYLDSKVGATETLYNKTLYNPIITDGSTTINILDSLDNVALVAQAFG